MINKSSIFILVIVFYQQIAAQTPHLQGEVYISVLNGTIECDLIYSNLPKLTNYSIWLNSGLNLRYFRDKDDKFNYANVRYYDSEKSWEAFQYFLPDSGNKGRFLPDVMKINYVGKFPVINDTLRASNRGDWKGNIAFNGKSIRASEQAAWYPVLYDIDNELTINKITYDLTINCADCESIYLNGSIPVKGTQARFKSDQPISMLLFAGVFDFAKNNNTYYINTSLTNDQESVLGDWTDKIIKFYEDNLNMPYGNAVTYLYTTPISKNNAWMFVTYPTIAIIGQEQYNVKSYFRPKTNILKDNSNIEYFAHELGHYYFGTVFMPNSDLHWFFLEGLTEYLALQTVKEVLGEESYQNKLNGYLNETKEYIPGSLKTIKNADIDETYRYIYAPMLLTVLEKEIGKESVWNWLKIILKTDSQVKTDYDFFKSTLIKSGLNENDFKRFEEKYITSDKAKDNVIDKIR